MKKRIVSLASIGVKEARHRRWGKPTRFGRKTTKPAPKTQNKLRYSRCLSVWGGYCTGRVVFGHGRTKKCDRFASKLLSKVSKIEIMNPKWTSTRCIARKWFHRVIFHTNQFVRVSTVLLNSSIFGVLSPITVKRAKTAKNQSEFQKYLLWSRFPVMKLPKTTKFSTV